MCSMYICDFFFCNRKPAYEMRISDWSSDVCSSDLAHLRPAFRDRAGLIEHDGLDEPEALESLAGAHQDAPVRRLARAAHDRQRRGNADRAGIAHHQHTQAREDGAFQIGVAGHEQRAEEPAEEGRSEEHTSELQSLMRISSAVIVLNK